MAHLSSEGERALADLVRGMEAHFGLGIPTERTAAHFLSCLMLVGVVDVVSSIRDLITAAEQEKLGLSEWAFAHGDRFSDLSHALGIANVATAHIIEIGGHSGAVSVYCELDEAMLVRKAGVGCRTVSLSWVAERAIPQVALHRLVDRASPSEVWYDEDLWLNKIELPHGGEI